jgi:membrane protein implicated in regulation of membrane protease activity
LPLLNAIAKAGVGFAILLAALGQVITFVPGAEATWFGVAALSASAGVITTNRRLQAMAVVLVVALALLAGCGYLRGLHYQEQLRKRGSACHEGSTGEI